MSAPVIDQAVATLREFLHHSGALRAEALVDAGAGAPPAIVSCARLGAIEVAFGDQELLLPHDVELEVGPADFGAVRQLPPFAVDAERGEVTGAVGGLQHLGDAVGRLARALGGASAAVVSFETTDAEVPLVLAAREGEPVVVTLGDETFEL